MERESFESDEVGKLLNDSFVSIKVDREERPDVDKVYVRCMPLLLHPMLCPEHRIPIVTFGAAL